MKLLLDNGADPFAKDAATRLQSYDNCLRSYDMITVIMRITIICIYIYIYTHVYDNDNHTTTTNNNYYPVSAWWSATGTILLGAEMRSIDVCIHILYIYIYIYILCACGLMMRCVSLLNSGKDKGGPSKAGFLNDLSFS